MYVINIENNNSKVLTVLMSHDTNTSLSAYARASSEDGIY